MLAIFKRELKSYFYSPIAYVLIGFFILLSSVFFLPNLTEGNTWFTGNLSTMAVFLVFIVPILTMRILAEDRKNGTEVLLITSPTNLTNIVLGKYFAAFSVFLVMTCITFAYPVILMIFGNPPMPQIIGGYIGFIFLGAAFIAVGLFASSLTENQVIAAVVGFVGLLIMWVMDGVSNMFANVLWGKLSMILDWFSLLSRYQDFSAGILNLGPIMYYVSFSAVFLFLTIRVIEKRRWSQG